MECTIVGELIESIILVGAKNPIDALVAKFFENWGEVFYLLYFKVEGFVG
ncbi:hypothetical protein [Nocardiopsis ansamitocini]|nr:hypothetical protein [Nocardiopsis ansamitocini]